MWNVIKWGFILLGVTAISWGITIAIIKLIALCFGISFSLLVATGIWLCLLLLKTIFGGNK